MKKIIVFLSLVILMGLGFKYWQDKTFWFNQKQVSQRPISQVKKYEGNSVIFEYPKEWNPSPKNLESGVQLETVVLGIPGVSGDQELGFLVTSLNELNFSDLYSQEYKIFNSREWVLGVRKKDGLVTYLYYTNFPHDPSTEDRRQSFGLHVTTSLENPALEKQLENLIKSLEFK